MLRAVVVFAFVAVYVLQPALAQPELLACHDPILIKWVEPVYPAEVRIRGIRGKVMLNVVVGKDGHVLRVEVLGGPPILVEAAKVAVMQWLYRPPMLNGEPVEVTIKVQVSFPRPKSIKAPSAVRCG
jgi:TonB family protein